MGPETAVYVLWALVVLVAMQAIFLGLIYLQVRRTSDEAEQVAEHLNDDLERFGELLDRIERERVIERTREVLDSGRDTASELRDRAQQLTPTLAEAEESSRHLRRVLSQLEDEELPVKLSLLMDETNKLVMSLEETALKIDAIVSDASDLREDVADRLTATGDRIRNLLQMLKGIRSGVGKGLQVLLSPEQGSGDAESGEKR